MGTPEDSSLDELARRVSAARAATEARGETFYQGASRVHLAAFPPRERWDDWVELSSRASQARAERHYMLVPTTCFNCESACGLLAYVDRGDLGPERRALSTIGNAARRVGAPGVIYNTPKGIGVRSGRHRAAAPGRCPH